MDDSVAKPKSLKFKEPVIDVAFSPASNLVASSLITGHVFIHRYAVDGNERKHRQKAHKKSCRSLCFSGDGSLLYSASKDRAWQAMDVATGREKTRYEGAHDKAINLVKYVNEQIIATGDEAGGVKLWDIRKNKPAFSYKEHVDYISDMVFNEEKRHLLATSGDGCLSVYDVRKSKPFQVSENQDDELLSLAVMKSGKKVVVGETDGVLGIFSYGQFGDVTDRFPGHPQSIDSICKLTEDLCVTGSSDGLLRIVQLFPHKLVGIAGDHESLPIEKVVLSYDQQWLASSSHDHTVHFWDIGYIFNSDDEDENEDEDAQQAEENEELDAQAVAIRISKEINDQSDVDVDIDGYSDATDLNLNNNDSDNNNDSNGDSENSDSDNNNDSNGDSENSDSENSDSGNGDSDESGEEQEDEEGSDENSNVDIVNDADTPSSKAKNTNAKEDQEEGSGSDGWGSWGDSDDSDDSDDDNSKTKKTKKAKMSKMERLKAKRKAQRQLTDPSIALKKRKNSAAAFFSDL
ncbi:WD domain repeat-containing protein 55 [Dipsacomyces acuminosporus]|nr:WD domain repeat-containing protein 55 [Dipsacomyces acuminosporus]